MAEQIASTGKQLFFDPVLGRTHHERRGCLLLRLRQRLAEPRHGPIQMMQCQRIRSCHGVALFPLLGRSIAARRRQAMQDGEEHSAFHGELELPRAQHIPEHRTHATLLPQAFEDERRTNDAGARGEGLAVSVSAQNSVLVREPAQGREQGIQLAGGKQFIEPTQAMQHALTDLAADTLVLDHDKVGAVAVGLGADEHRFCVSSLA
jgi:hypothetical protein